MSSKRSIIPIFVPHLGCPNNCVFCNQRKISGSLSAPGLKELESAISEGLEKVSGKENIQLAFYGGSFTAIPLREQQMLLEGALPFLRSGSISSLRVSTRPDSINRETLERLKVAGVSTIELGVQSMDEGVLALSGRGHTARDAESAVQLIKEAGFETILQMMTGLPGDTREKSLETARRIIALSPDGVRIYPTVVIKDTPLFDMWQAGTYAPHNVEEAVDWCGELLPLFEAAGIPVIRLGLNPSDELSGGDAAAGAYHPAFGELVRSKILLERARALCGGVEPGADILLGVEASDISPMTGHKRANLKALSEEFSLGSVKVKTAMIKKGEVVLL